MRISHILGYRVWGMGYGKNPILLCYGENTELQRTYCLARGDESCGDNLYSNKEFSKRRTLWDSFSNSESGSIHSSEYSRRLWSQKQSRIHKLFIYCKRFFNRNRDSFVAIAKDRLLDKRANERTTKTIEYCRQATNRATQIHINKNNIVCLPQTLHPIPHTQACKFRFNRGFGLLEVMLAAVVLGFLLVGLNLMQKGNRDAVLRIRTRDAAQIIAQNFIDSLSRLGISSLEDDDTERTETVDYEWKGNDEKITDKRSYTIKYKIKAVDNLKSIESSDYARSLGNGDTLRVSAKRVELTVSWQFKNTTLNIKEERIIK